MKISSLWGSQKKGKKKKSRIVVCHVLVTVRHKRSAAAAVWLLWKWGESRVARGTRAWTCKVPPFLYVSLISLSPCAEPAAAQPDGALPDRAEPQPPHLPDPAAGGAARTPHTHTCPLLQEETSPRGQHHPQQVGWPYLRLCVWVWECSTRRVCF